MGQRANYILIEKGKQHIHYHHWRANCVGADLYLGETRFVEFVRSCQLKEQLLDEVWIEGCVIIDIDKKRLQFWSLELGATTATDFYLTKLQEKWIGWSVNLLRNKMYDVEKILKIDYISQQEIRTSFRPAMHEIFDEDEEDSISQFIVLKTKVKLHIIRLGYLYVEGILSIGDQIIDALLVKKQSILPKEEDDKVYVITIIDLDQKSITVSESEFGIWEHYAYKWPGYTFKMGDFGYIGALKLAGIATENLIMSHSKTLEMFTDIIKSDDDFDPGKLAVSLLKEQPDAKFNVDFFDNVKPKRSLIERISNFLQRLFK